MKLRTGGGGGDCDLTIKDGIFRLESLSGPGTMLTLVNFKVKTMIV